ncbi:TlyA family RNA methyltransferase [Gardnerella vaginalis]|uniref:TlyA family RNA methyltransferase n=1 Tax=Gardnerella vaginalis TaxID=2702 RepID=UPI0039EF175F
MSEDGKLKVLTDSSATQRLDCALVNRDLAESRTIAQRLIKAGAVSVSNRTITKPSFLVNNSEEIIIKKSEKLEESEYCLKYVSRGALKLEGAFDAFSKYGLSTSNSTRALDIGASTGGFCDVLLQKGVDKVIALDVGHGQLHPKIANDPRVIEMSGVNIRDVYEENLPYKPNLIVSDVSFISLTLVIPTIARIAEQNADIVLLVKPQFEVGKGNLGKGGIVTDESLRIKALENVKNCAKANNLTIIATEKSPIEGTHGNIEYLLYARFAS